MSYIAIPIPQEESRHDIQIEVTVNNQKQSLRYKVELFYWDDCQNPKGHRADCLSELLAGHDPNWKVYFIGAPNEKFVPITFQEKAKTI